MLWRLPIGLRRPLFPILWPGVANRLRAGRRGDPSQWFSLAPFDELRCIFVHIPKCAGKSVGEALFGGFTGHFYLRQYEMLFSREEFDRYFKFTFVRNPWDRTVSAFEFLKQGGLNQADREWAERHLARIDDFEQFCREWLTPENANDALFFTPQHRFLRLGSGFGPAVDFVGRVENLAEDFTHVAKRLGIDTSVPHLNRSSRRSDFRSYYSPETRRIVESVYAEDIELFGYTFD
jgi:hypothetical protein